MADIQVIAEKCIACGICVDSCPNGAMKLDGDVAQILDTCNLCGACVEECPEKAIVKAGVDKNTDGLDVSHLADCKNIWVFTELRAGKIAGCTFELLGEAQRLVAGKGHQVAALLLCDEAGDYPQQLIAGGADRVYVVENQALKHFRDQPYTSVIYHLVQEEKPLAMLFSATAVGRSLAPRLAARLQTGLSADCTQLELQDNGLLIQTRPAFGGNLFASILCPRTWPQMATVRPKVMKPLEPDATRQGQVIPKNYALDEATIATMVLDCILQLNESSVDEAEVVVTAGFGAADEKGIQLVSELAAAFGGALGATRKMVDAGHLNYERQVGQTGKTVGPKLYIACGVSGAVQHIVGISSAKTIVAIDQDPNAPIFQVADIGIVADLYQFIPQLIAAQKARQELNA